MWPGITHLVPRADLPAVAVAPVRVALLLVDRSVLDRTLVLLQELTLQRLATHQPIPVASAARPRALKPTKHKIHTPKIIFLKHFKFFSAIVQDLKTKPVIQFTSTHLSPVTIIPDSVSAGVDAGFDVGRRVTLANSVQTAHLSASGAYTAALLVCNNALGKAIKY